MYQSIQTEIRAQCDSCDAAFILAFYELGKEFSDLHCPFCGHKINQEPSASTANGTYFTETDIMAFPLQIKAGARLTFPTQPSLTVATSDPTTLSVTMTGSQTILEAKKPGDVTLSTQLGSDAMASLKLSVVP